MRRQVLSENSTVAKCATTHLNEAYNIDLNGNLVRYLGMTEAGYFVWEDDKGNLHIPSNESYYKKNKESKNGNTKI